MPNVIKLRERSAEQLLLAPHFCEGRGKQEKTGMEKSDGKSGEKAGKRKRLRYPVKEADGLSSANVWREGTTGANGKHAIANQGFNIRRMRITAEKEGSTDVYGEGKVYLVNVTGAFLRSERVRGDHCGKVVHDESSKDFL